MPLRRIAVALVAFAVVLAASALLDRPAAVDSQAPQPTDFTNFESHPVHPIALSPSGNRLFVVNVPDARLAVFDVTPGGLALAQEIPVGLEPVSVAALTDDVVWVVNHLSDDVSIVDIAAGNVVRTLRVGDEPTDVVFARTSTSPSAPTVAFVCVSQEDVIRAYDPETLFPIDAPIPVFGMDPRALTLSNDRTRVHVAAFESGNRTSVVPFQEVLPANGGLGLPPPNPAMDAALPPAPDVALVVRHDGTAWRDELGRSWSFKLPYTVADRDLFTIDAATRSVVEQVTGVGTLNFNLATHPVTGEVWVTNTDARNEVRFEPNLRGNLVRNRVSIVTPGSGAVNGVHLNPHVNYAVSPGGAGEIALSLAQPTDLRFRPDGTKAYVAALGSNKVGVLDGTTAAVTNRIPVGQGPVGLALSADGARLFAYNRFDNSISVIDTGTETVVATVPVGFDPTPAVIRTGRPFLYDASLTSGHGDASCASCHAFGNNDALAWDLGDPRGALLPPPPNQIDPLLGNVHPMKGPMVTQSLRGLAGTGRLHWRADRADFNAFNGAFVSLNGRADTLSAADMQAYTDFVMTIQYPPNPNRALNDSLPNPVNGPNPRRGLHEFVNATHDALFRCNVCHALPTGTNGQSVHADVLLEDQDMKVPHMRNMHEKRDFSRAPGAVNKAGFGFTHDGAFDNLVNFLKLPVFQFPGGDPQMRDVEAFLFAFPTAMRPAVGYRTTLHAGNRDLLATTRILDSLYTAAGAGACDLVVKGKVAGLARGFRYDPLAQTFAPDRVSEPALSKTALRALAGPGSELTWFGVPPGSGVRMGIDRDRDGFRDRDELDAGSNPGNPLSTPTNVAVGDDPKTTSITLSGGVPNPFGQLAAGHAKTVIRFSLPVATDTRLEVYDARGRKVIALVEGVREAGEHAATWDGRDATGRPVPTGVYFYRLTAASQTRTAKGLRL